MTKIFYFSATGNSLYVAQVLKTSGTEIFSIPQELRNKNFEVDSEKVGFIFPLHYGGLPIIVEEFLQKLNFVNTKYIFAVCTCGIPFFGRAFKDLKKILADKNLNLNASWYVRLVSNYLPLRDTAADWRIKLRYIYADWQLKKICAAISKSENHTSWEIFKDKCKQIHDEWERRRANIDEKFICDVTKCVKCGMCEKICPVKNISRPNGSPVWNGNCVECLGCLHICPKKAIDFGEITKGRKRYINWNIKPKDLIDGK